MKSEQTIMKIYNHPLDSSVYRGYYLLFTTFFPQVIICIFIAESEEGKVWKKNILKLSKK